MGDGVSAEDRRAPDGGMERTELREAFFAEARNDPYAAMILHHVADAWVRGYEEALRANGLPREKSHSELHNEAVERLTDERNKAQAQALIAFAEVGKLLGEPRLSV